MRSASASRSEKFGNYARPAAPLLLLILSLALLLPGVAAAATAPSLGTARSFAVLGGSTVTNTGPSSVEGDLGVSPGNTAPGFPPGMVTGGTFHLADAVALQAQDDVTTAYNALRGQVCEPGNDLTGQDLGGKTLLAGVYCYSSSAQLTGALTLDAQGDAGAVFIFKIASTLTTASNATVLVINGGSPCNVYWQVGSSATLGTGNHVRGEHPRADEHHAQHRRHHHPRAGVGAQRRGDAGYQYDLHRRLRVGGRALADSRPRDGHPGPARHAGGRAIARPGGDHPGSPRHASGRAVAQPGGGPRR
jgi:hypothetical protein